MNKHRLFFWIGVALIILISLALTNLLLFGQWWF
jgi:hypothetical protein